MEYAPSADAIAANALALLPAVRDPGSEPGVLQDALEALEKRLKEYVKNYVDSQMETLKQELMKGIPQPAPKVVKKKSADTKGSCFVCGGTTNVHRHRELRVFLDDRCRKQVETVILPSQYRFASHVNLDSQYPFVAVQGRRLHL